jgi:hypothetical protein
MDGKPVDDIDTAIVTDGVTIALSSAMPGLVGATMRSGGPLASLRASISYKPSRHIQDLSSGTIRLKLFNSVMGELGEQFLRKGVRVESSVLAEWLWSRPEDFRRRQCNVSINGNEHMIEILKIIDLLKSKDVCLRVNWEKPEVS